MMYQWENESFIPDAVVFFYKIAENKKLKKSLSVKFLQSVTDSDALLFIFLKL
jgi:hypothetical protein